MFGQFTDCARRVMALANQEAQGLRHSYIGTEHILLGLIKEGAGVGANMLKKHGVSLPQAREQVAKLVRPGEDEVAPDKLPVTPRAKRVFEYAIEESRSLSHSYVCSEHLLLGLLRETDGVAAQVLLNLELRLSDIRDEVYTLLGTYPSSRVPNAAMTEAGAVAPPRTPDSHATPPEAVIWLLKQMIAALEEEMGARVTRAEYERAAELRDIREDARALLHRVQRAMFEE